MSTARTSYSLTAIETDASRLVTELGSAIEAARAIRDAAHAATGRGLRDDDLRVIDRHGGFLASAVERSAKARAELATETERLPETVPPPHRYDFSKMSDDELAERIRFTHSADEWSAAREEQRSRREDH